MAQDRKPKHYDAELKEETETDDHPVANVQRASQQVQIALEGLTLDQKRQVVASTGLLQDQPTTDELWRWLIRSFCGIAIISAIGIVLIGFGIHVGSGASAQIPLAVFTATIGFLGALPAKSPAGNGDQ